MSEQTLEKWAHDIGQAVEKAILQNGKSQGLTIELTPGDDAAIITVNPTYRLYVMRSGTVYSTQDGEWMV